MSDHWGTPDWLMSVFENWFDPCPPFSYDDDLEGIWTPSKVYVNPPYSNPAPWVDKAIRTNATGRTVVMLLKHDSSTQWYRRLVENGARFMMIEGRLSFKDLTGSSSKGCHASPFPSILAILPGVI